MKSMVSVVSLTVMLAVSLPFAQVKHPLPQQETRDSAPPVMTGTPAQDPDNPGAMEKMRRCEGKERWRDKTTNGWECRPSLPRGTGMMSRSFPRFGPLCVLCTFLFMALLALVNILLTILVTLDMARLNRFNGLWIPVLLIAGLPGTALYALFRIGDGVRELVSKMK